MTRAAILLAGLLSWALTCLGAAGAAPTRVALVIGNGAYTAVPALPNPPADAEAIGQALRNVGFSQVTVLTDLTHQGLYDALRRFAEQSRTADWSVLYYAGHGIEVGGRNYLVPVDAHLASDRDVEFEAVPMQTVLAAVGGARQLRLVILDACRDDPFLARMTQGRATRSIERGLARVAPEGDLYLVYSAKSGQVAVDGQNGRSPFVAALLKTIETPGLEINLLFRRVHAEVKEASDGRQEPDFEGTLPADELYFKPASPGAPASPEPPVAEVAPSPRPSAPRVPEPVESPPTPPAREPETPPSARVASARPESEAVGPRRLAGYAYVTGLDPQGDDFLALKAAPALRAQRLLKMGPGTLVTVLDRAGPWMRVQLRDGRTGWAYGRYLACCREDR